MADWIIFALSALLTLGGLAVLVTSVLGLFRFRYALNRVHAAALCDTLGILLMLLGVMLATGLNVTTGKMALVIIFLWLTSPVSSHLIGKMEVTMNPSLGSEMNVQDPAAVAEERQPAAPEEDKEA